VEEPDRRWSWPTRVGGWWRLLLLTSVCYLAGSLVARWLLDQSDLAAVFFIPAGVTVAFLIRTERRVWWAVLLAAGATELAVNLIPGYPPIAHLGFVLANVVEPLLGALIVVGFVGALDLSRLRHVGWYIAGAVFLAPAAGAAIGATGVAVAAGQDFMTTFLQWWLGDALGVVVVGAGILVWGSSADRRPIVSAGGGVLLLAAVVFTLVDLRSGLAIGFLKLVAMVVAAVAMGSRAVMVTSIAIAVTTATEVAFGSPVFETGVSTDTSLLIIKMSLGVFTLAGLLVAAEAAEGRQAMQRAAEARVRLQLERSEHRIDRRISNDLQRALLPVALVDHPDLRIAAQYEAGTEQLLVGGDWYDAFAMPDGRVALTIGDVVGQGIEASAAMGRMRTAVNVLAMDYQSPGELMTSLDDYARGAGDIPFATAIFAVIDPETGTLAYASAGHPPLLLVEPDSSTRWLAGGLSPPLGGATEVERKGAETTISPGSIVIGYSDGLIERKGEDLSFGLARLAEAGRSVAGMDPADVCDRIFESLTSGQPRDDDLVVIAVRYSPIPAAPTRENTIPAIQSKT
jgi:serine phosphatase RsbU (regulator of sigma subunit)/integral membrane sensor domain MASE1